MPYLIVDIDIAEPLPVIRLASDDRGLALIVRREGRPIGFLMRQLPENTQITRETLAEWIGSEIPRNGLAAKLPFESDFPANSSSLFPSLSIAICTRDRPESLERCLESLRAVKNGCLWGETIETLVIDNAPSDDRTQRIIGLFPGIRYYKERKPGLDFARNRALREASKEIVAYVDDDVVVDRKWLDGLQEAWRENPDSGAFTGQVLPFELATDAQILAEKLGGFRKGFEKVRYGPEMSQDPLYPCTTVFGNGCNMAFNRRLALKLGGFDEALDTGPALPGGGDLDMLYRVIRSGFPVVYEPMLLVYHQHRREYRQLRSQICRSWGTGCMAFLLKVYRTDPAQRLKAHQFIQWWLKDLLSQLRRSLAGNHVRKPDMVLAEFWGALLGLMGSYKRSQKRIAKIRRQFA